MTGRDGRPWRHRVTLRLPSASTPAMPDKPHSPSCERNQDPILDVLRTHFAGRRHVLEIGSGTGQHAAHFAAAMPSLVWQCSDAEAYLPGIRMWLDEARLPNTPAPFALQAVAGPASHFAPQPVPVPRDAAGARSGYDAVFSANTLHIMGWPEVQALFASLPTVLTDDATVAVYGPFNIGGEFTSDSNRQFDGWLKARDPRSGIRDFEAVEALAEGIGLRLVAHLAMPANNRMLVWRRGTIAPV
jgi:SAM-dependent methyltransferase